MEASRAEPVYRVRDENGEYCCDVGHATALDARVCAGLSVPTGQALVRAKRATWSLWRFEGRVRRLIETHKQRSVRIS